MFDRVFLVSWILFFRILNFVFHIMIFVFHILNFHFVKSVQIRSFLWCVFYRIRTEYEEIVFLRIQSEFMKIRTRKNSVFGHFTRSVCFPYLEFCFFRSWILIFLNYGIFCVFESSKREQFKTQIRWDALHDLVPFVQFQKRKNHPWSYF